MRTIWKFRLEVTDEQLVVMPEGAEILTVQVQGGVPCLWTVVDPHARTAAKTILIHGTGHPMSDHAGRYIGTFQMAGGGLVFHVFDAVHPIESALARAAGRQEGP